MYTGSVHNKKIHLKQYKNLGNQKQKRKTYSNGLTLVHKSSKNRPFNFQ